MDFLAALGAGKVEPFSHAPKPGKALTELDPETRAQIKPIIAKITTRAVSDAAARALKSLENPLPLR